MGKMGGTWNVIALVISVIYIGDYLIKQPEQVSLFGFDVPHLVYLLFWGVCLAGCLSSILKARRKA